VLLLGLVALIVIVVAGVLIMTGGEDQAATTWISRSPVLRPIRG
jgi:hypothetical protein